MTALTSSVPVLADWGGHMNNWGTGWWIVMMIGMVLFWALVILGVVWLVRSLGGQHGAPGGAAHALTPLEMLEHRLAEGSITVEEYEERRRVLTGSGPSSGSS